MERYKISESGQVSVIGYFSEGDSVTIKIYDKNTGLVEPILNNSCSEIDNTRVFRWSFSDLTTPPTEFKQFLHIMSNGDPLYDQRGETTFGNWNDLTAEEVDTVLSAFHGSGSWVGVPDVNAMTETITNGVKEIFQPITADICRVKVGAMDQDGGFNEENNDFIAQVTALPYEINNNYIVGDRIYAKLESALKYFYFDVVYGATVLFTSKKQGIRKEAVIPSQSEIELKDLTAL